MYLQVIMVGQTYYIIQSMERLTIVDTTRRCPVCRGSTDNRVTTATKPRGPPRQD